MSTCKQTLLLLSVLAYLITCSCTAVSNNLFQSAQTLKPGTAKIGIGIGTGLDANYLSAEPIADSAFESGIIDTFGMAFKILFQPTFRIGVTSNMDVGMLLWFSPVIKGLGAKVYTKVGLLPSDFPVKAALMPTIMGSYTELGSDSEITIIRFFGAELPFIISYQFPNAMSLYAAPTYSYYATPNHLYSIDNPHSHYLHRIGINIGVQIQRNRFSICPELVPNFIYQPQSKHWKEEISFGAGFAWKIGGN